MKATGNSVVSTIVEDAVAQAIKSGELPLDQVPAVELERPRDPAHGDWATALALRTSAATDMTPRAIADIIVSHLRDHPDIEAVEVACPGFI
ncbi:MAG: arginine--tRNA ligase, partial [Coriobacteriia bacterium]|nr:arginine--tRNA ligase [Coriobacteriia bacterium]